MRAEPNSSFQRTGYAPAHLLTFLERLAAQVPRPLAHQHTYHGVLAPAAPYRDLIVPRAREIRPACADTPVDASFTAALAVLGLAGLASAQSGVVGWGAQVFDSRLNDETFVQLDAGGNHTVARRANGSIAAWGESALGQSKARRSPILFNPIRVLTSVRTEQPTSAPTLYQATPLHTK